MSALSSTLYKSPVLFDLHQVPRAFLYNSGDYNQYLSSNECLSCLLDHHEYVVEDVAFREILFWYNLLWKDDYESQSKNFWVSSHNHEHYTDHKHPLSQDLCEWFLSQSYVWVDTSHRTRLQGHSSACENMHNHLYKSWASEKSQNNFNNPSSPVHKCKKWYDKNQSVQTWKLHFDFLEYSPIIKP